MQGQLITVKPQSNERAKPAQDTRSGILFTPNGFLFRPRTYYLPELKRALDEAYREWKKDLPELEYEALLNWYGRGYRAINTQFRKGNSSPAAEQLQKSINSLISAINLAPSVPPVVKELFRGESHESLTLAEAQRRCAERVITNLSVSFLAASIYENEAFNFARDYHSSGFTDGGLMIPIGALQKPVAQQIIFRYVLPEDRTEIRAAWIGQTIGGDAVPPQHTRSVASRRTGRLCSRR